MALKENHYVLNGFLLRPSGFNHLQATLTYSRAGLQTVGILLDHIKRIGPERCHQAFGCDGSNSFDQTGTQVFFDSPKGRGFENRVSKSMELYPELRVTGPCAVNPEFFAWVDIREYPNHHHAVGMPAAGGTQNRVSILRVSESYAFKHDGDAFRFHSAIIPEFCK